MMEGIEVLSIGSIGINQVFNWEAAIAGGLVLGFLCSLYTAAKEYIENTASGMDFLLGMEHNDLEVNVMEEA